MSSAVAIGHEHEHGREAIRENLRAFVAGALLRIMTSRSSGTALVSKSFAAS
jgi:hypothetical protein